MVLLPGFVLNVVSWVWGVLDVLDVLTVGCVFVSSKPLRLPPPPPQSPQSSPDTQSTEPIDIRQGGGGAGSLQA